jgi:predicted transcriptional regulator of viral defense system
MKSSERQSKNAIKANIKAKHREEKRIKFASTLKVQQKPKTVFVATPEGTAKRLAHKSRWRTKSDLEQYV